MERAGGIFPVVSPLAQVRVNGGWPSSLVPVQGTSEMFLKQVSVLFHLSQVHRTLLLVSQQQLVSQQKHSSNLHVQMPVLLIRDVILLMMLPSLPGAGTDSTVIINNTTDARRRQSAHARGLRAACCGL